MPFSLIVRRDYLIQHAFPPSHCTITHEIATWIAVSIFRDNRKHWDIYLVGYIYSLPIKYFLESRPRQNKVWIVGIVDSRTIVCEWPDPILHLTYERVCVCLSLPWKLLIIISAFLYHYIHLRTPYFHLFTLPSTPTVTPFLKQQHLNFPSYTTPSLYDYFFTHPFHLCILRYTP